MYIRVVSLHSEASVCREREEGERSGRTRRCIRGLRGGMLLGCRRYCEVFCQSNHALLNSPRVNHEFPQVSRLLLDASSWSFSIQETSNPSIIQIGKKIKHKNKNKRNKVLTTAHVLITQNPPNHNQSSSMSIIPNPPHFFPPDTFPPSISSLKPIIKQPWIGWQQQHTKLRCHLFLFNLFPRSMSLIQAMLAESISDFKKTPR